MLGVSAALPYLRISGAVINRVDNDFLILDLVENLVRKPLDQRTPHLAMYRRKLLRVFLDGRDAVVNLPQEIGAKFAISFVVPTDGLLSIVIGLWREPRLHFFLF